MQELIKEIPLTSGRYTSIQYVSFDQIDDSTLEDSTKSLGALLSTALGKKPKIQIINVNSLDGKKFAGMTEGIIEHIKGLRASNSVLIAFFDPHTSTPYSAQSSNIQNIIVQIMRNATYETGLKIADAYTKNHGIPFIKANSIEECISAVKDHTGPLLKEEEKKILGLFKHEESKP